MKAVYIRLFALVALVLSMNGCKSDDSGDDPNDPKAENLKSLGVSAEDLLSEDIYNSLTVEFIYVNGYQPLQETVDLFRVMLEDRLNKPGGINFIENVISIPIDESLTIQEIRDIETANREVYTTGDNIAVYIYFANGNSNNDTNTSVTLGTAYRNTSLVVYEKTLQFLSGNQGIDLVVLEATTLMHEFGHILGLVNIVNDDIHQEHEDLNHANHCFVEECLMYFESTNFRALANKRRSEIPGFDPLCIADLQAKGGK